MAASAATQRPHGTGRPGGAPFRLVATVGGSLIVAVVVGAASWTVGSVVRDDVVLDWIVLAVALDWRDFGHERAVARLQYELDRRAIGSHVADDDCVLVRTPEGLREVRCDWAVDVRVPFAGTVSVPFSSRAVVDPDGGLW